MADIEYKINRLTESLMDDYGKGRVIDEIKMFEYPDRDVVIDILEKLRIVIYPGYYRNRNYRTYTVRNNISILLEDIIYNLIKQTSIVLKYAPEYSDADDQTIAKASEEITFKFLDTLPKIREYIETDIQAAYDGDPAAYNKDEIICTYPGLFAIFTSRVAHELFLLGVPMIPRIMTEHAHSLTGIDIHPGTTIGKYFFIDHGTGIVIGETTEIGNNVKIYQGVTLGALSTRGGQNLRGKKRHPTICDNVTIYSGASILGGETVVGKNVVVGGNAFITTSIPEGAKVSVKSQELMYNYDSKHPVERKDVELDDAWFYVI
ncbi:MAG: serine acetyltransferase [Ruminococcus sp.]|jgi:serine O-acetyltransferase|uniref:serine O-acetyltransferase n=1 Tax=Ruminococcus sp. TaxID=41978 RepID=UPI00292D91A8|nr:serine acetyltransferase [uncultured Ruminococcus sp.]MBQ1353417.1 serine acetyltransferase [Ruminococcus sp.]MBQ1595250.1 serine acetyltransferase [Ruminococcus sp.]MBQ1717349.1 serine acetyltransferase [Ruminococcus sp.]MBQ2280733.1 serine acetyltransferase [Ruminococcus sp.]MBQ4250625.1 serine acetyltransferase [Ruminococcus sp.]